MSEVKTCTGVSAGNTPGMHCRGCGNPWPHACERERATLVEARAAVTRLTAELAETHWQLSNEELPYKAAKADCERLRGELAASEATVRVHEFTIRNVSTARDTASASLEAARGLIGYSADALEAFAEWAEKHQNPAPAVTAFVTKLRAFLAPAPPATVKQDLPVAAPPVPVEPATEPFGPCCESARRIQRDDATLLGYDCAKHGWFPRKERWPAAAIPRETKEPA